jgi:hypothetical protein
VARRPAFALLFAIVACSSSPSGTLQIVTGGELDTFSRAPQPASLEVDAVDASGNKRTLAKASLPVSSIDLGSLDPNATGTLQVTGTGSDGNRLIYGQSLPILFGALDGLTLPIFVQRTGELARMPGPLSDARSAPLLALLAGRFLLVSAGSDSSLSHTTQLYDFASFAPIAAPRSLTRVPKSIAWVGMVAWLIDEAGATEFDFSTGKSLEVTAPAGGSFGDVSGGATVFATDGSQYIVGATRTTGAPTQAVLFVDTKGNSSWIALSARRLGAGATWVDGRGLVVAAGSATAGGVEVLSAGATSGALLSYPPDPAAGGAAATLDPQHVILAGGVTTDGQDPGIRAVDLGCNAQCGAAPWAPLPVSLAPAQLFASGPGDALVVGDDPSGTTRVYRLSMSAATAVPTKVMHTGARALVSPVGSVVVVGGANEIESFLP